MTYLETSLFGKLSYKTDRTKCAFEINTVINSQRGIRHFSLLNVNVAGACGYDFRCDGGRLVREYLRR